MALRLPARHPRGLYALCAVELCERFAASLFGSLLLLYLHERLGMALAAATRWSGSFHAMVYLSSVIGGFVTDRWLGTRRAVVLGTVLLAAGYLTLSVDAARLLYPAAALLVAGHALFKPSISAAVGHLYKDTDPRRTDAYSLFYVVFNLGVAGGPVTGAFLHQHAGWGGAFFVAALAMGIALLMGLLCYRCLIAPDAASSHAPTRPAGRVQAWPVTALSGLLVATWLFTAVNEQSGLSLLLWARDCTQRTLLGRDLPASVWLSLPGLCVLATQPLLRSLTDAWTRRLGEPSLLARVRIGLACGVLAYAIMALAASMQNAHQMRLSPLWLLACFIALTFGELLVYPLSMALITRVAPATARTITLGLFLASLAGGHWLAGAVAAHWTTWRHALLFGTLAGLSLLALVNLSIARRAIDRACESAPRVLRS